MAQLFQVMTGRVDMELATVSATPINTTLPLRHHAHRQKGGCSIPVFPGYRLVS